MTKGEVAQKQLLVTLGLIAWTIGLAVMFVITGEARALAGSVALLIGAVFVWFRGAGVSRK